MKTPTLRTRLVLVAGLVWVYSLGVAASYRRQSRAHARLEASFHQGLTTLAALPRVRDQLRRMDQYGDQYLLTGQPSWLERREEALDEVRASLAELGSAAPGEREVAVIGEAERRLGAYLAERSPWISRRRAGRLSPADAARATRRAVELDSVAAPLNELKNVNVADLQARRKEAEDASRAGLTLILLAGAAAAGFVAILLSRALIGPVAVLRDDARAWKLGAPWDFPPPRGAGPEVADLRAAMGEMATRLNAQFAREAELGRLKGSLVSMASHEFNNALSVLGTTVNLLKQTEPAAPSGRRGDYYEIVETNLRSLSLATRNLLDLGLLESGRFAVRPHRADLGAVLRAAAKSLQPIYERKEIEFSLELPEGLPPAKADPEALVMVATNLVGNAVKYAPEGGKVSAGVSVGTGGRLRVFVADNGIGIAPQDREAILTGHRTEQGRKAAAGFGVGLVLVKKILDAHGAELEIEGAPGKGSRFSFVLPRWEGPGESLFA